MLVLKVLLLQVAVIMFNSFLFSHSVLYWFFFKKKKSYFTYKKNKGFLFSCFIVFLFLYRLAGQLQVFNVGFWGLSWLALICARLGMEELLFVDVE